jgi:hypothetical protein
MSVDRSDARLQKLATAAVYHWHEKRRDQAVKVIEQIATDYDGDAVVQAMLLWIDSALNRVGAKTGHLNRITFLNANSGQVNDADSAPPHIAWAGRLLNARLVDDEAMFTALIAAVPDEATWGANVQGVLDICVQMIFAADPSALQFQGPLTDERIAAVMEALS